MPVRAIRGQSISRENTSFCGYVSTTEAHGTTLNRRYTNSPSLRQKSQLSKPFPLSAAGTLIAAQIVAIVVNHISRVARNLLFCAQHVVGNKCCFCYIHSRVFSLDSLDFCELASKEFIFSLPYRAEIQTISTNHYLLKIQRLSLGSPKISNFWGEEKWRQAKLVCEFHLASPFRRRSGCNWLRSTLQIRFI